MTTFAGQWGPEALISSVGVPYLSTAFSVMTAGTSTPATLYGDRTKGSTVSNPGRTTDSKGNATFFVDPGSYDLVVLGVVVLPGIRVFADDADIGALIPSGTYAQGLTDTPVKTASYTASPGDYVRIDATAGSVNIPLPAAPPDRTRIGAKLVATSGTNVGTIACSGSDHFNLSTGGTSFTLSLPNQAAIFQYNAGAAVWTVQASDFALSTLVTTSTDQNVTGIKRFTAMPEIKSASNVPIIGKALGSGLLAPFEIQHDDTQAYLFHLTSGPNMGGSSAFIGLGVGSTVTSAGSALLINNYGMHPTIGSIGIALTNLSVIANTLSYGLSAYQNSEKSPLIKVAAGRVDHAPLFQLAGYASANAGTHLAEVSDSAGIAGYIQGDSAIIDWKRTIQTGATGAPSIPLIRVFDETTNPTEAYLISKFSSEVGLRVYRNTNGSGTAMYSFGLLGTSDRFKLQAGAGAATKGAETLNTMIEIRCNATPQMAFFGAAVVAQPASTTDIKTALVSLGLIAAAGGATPLNLEGGTLTAATAVFSGSVSLANGTGLNIKDNGGVARGVAFISAGNVMTMGSTGVGNVYYQGNSILFTPGATPVTAMTVATSGIFLADGFNLWFGSTSGNKIGTATTQKLAFWNATPIVQPSGTPAAATDLASVITLANDLRTKLLALGLAA